MQNKDDAILSIIEPNGASTEFPKNWARLIQKIYEVDPLTSPKYQNQMKIISVIENEKVIKKILKHLGLWDLKTRPPPKATGPSKITEYNIDYSTTQLSVSDNLSRALRSNEWLYVDPEYPEAFPS